MSCRTLFGLDANLTLYFTCSAMARYKFCDWRFDAPFYKNTAFGEVFAGLNAFFYVQLVRYADLNLLRCHTQAGEFLPYSLTNHR